MTLFALFSWWMLRGHPPTTNPPIAQLHLLHSVWVVSVALAAATAATLALNEVVNVEGRGGVFYTAQAVLGYMTGLAALSEVPEADDACMTMIVGALVLFVWQLCVATAVLQGRRRR
jgi:hypothetical protein